MAGIESRDKVLTLAHRKRDSILWQGVRGGEYDYNEKIRIG
jgi:hypothetical protein